MIAKIGDKYEIEADGQQFTLYKIVQKKADAKVNPGGMERKWLGYYSDLVSLINNFPNRALLYSGANDLAEAVKEVRMIAKEFEKILNEVMIVRPAQDVGGAEVTQEAEDGIAKEETPQEVEEAAI